MQDPADLRQHALILGLGDSGLAMAAWCARLGWEVTVRDNRERPPRIAELQTRVPQARFVSGPFDASALAGQSVHAVFKSPGLSPQQVQDLWQAAQAQGLWCGGELSLFARALQSLADERGYRPQVLAITGTNGKTTVTALTAVLLQRAGLEVAIAGNIGPTLLDTLTQCLEQGLPQAWVLELSSFQLSDSADFQPSAASVLNLSQDHLDWHGDMAAYATAKGRIFGASTLRVLRRDDPTVSGWMPPVVEVSRRALASAPAIATAVTFGADLPQRAGDFGLEEVNGMTWLVRAISADETLKRQKGEEEEIYMQRLMPADALRIRGRHNALNALAALALATTTGVALAPMLYGLREYTGEPHRVESVVVLSGVEYFDDSKGTNVGATVAAIEGLGVERRVWVILGGDGKGQDFSPLAAPVARYAAGVALIGRDAPQLAQALADTGVSLAHCDDLPAAVAWCHDHAQSGDAVLLSPACASFDMFRNYAHRGEVFCAVVKEMLDAGTH